MKINFTTNPNVIIPKVMQDITQKQNMKCEYIKVGEMKPAGNITSEQRKQLKVNCLEYGITIMDNTSDNLVQSIKAIITDAIFTMKNPCHINFPELLHKKLCYSYDHLEKIFKAQEGICISTFIIIQKIEKVIELRRTMQWTFGRIADEIGYKDQTHLSAQFKQVKGVYPRGWDFEKGKALDV